MKGHTFSRENALDVGVRPVLEPWGNARRERQGNARTLGQC